MDDHGIAQIARDLTAAEQEMKNELEGKKREAEKDGEKEEIVKTFQVVSGDMFSKIYEPVVRITTSSITFNKSCVCKMLTNYAELLFNPVERMLVVRPCKVDNPNAIPWDSNSRGASSLSKVLFATMGWEEDYSYRIPCQPLEGPNEEVVLFFDLDNYVGRAINKSEEVIIARKQVEMETDNSGKSYFYPPEGGGDEQEDIRHSGL